MNAQYCSLSREFSSKLGLRIFPAWRKPRHALPSSSVYAVMEDGSKKRGRGTKKKEGEAAAAAAAAMKVINKRKDNVWSIDNNDMARSPKKDQTGKKKKKKRNNGVQRKSNRDSRVIVSGAMLMEIETVLQTQEPVIKPAWNTFVSSVSGIWQGVGAVFSPLTAEMEPIGIGKKNEELYDCVTLSLLEKVQSPDGKTSKIQRKINWTVLNPYGEMHPNSKDNNAEAIATSEEMPSFEYSDLKASEVMEEDTMVMEPGLVFFEDGSYSRGPVEVPVGASDDPEYFLPPTFKFEQCLVKGCHKRLRIVHTIEFKDGGMDIQVIRVAVYEESWVSPAHVEDERCITDSVGEFDIKPFSQRKRVQPAELTGSWKVFEISATVIPGEDDETEVLPEGRPPYVYLCMETLKKRSLPESLVYFGEEDALDTQDVTFLWLPGGVTAYVDVQKDGVLCIGVGWYSVEGINLVMERDYGIDGKLKEVRSKSEVKKDGLIPQPCKNL